MCLLRLREYKASLSRSFIKQQSVIIMNYMIDCKVCQILPQHLDIIDHLTPPYPGAACICFDTCLTIEVFNGKTDNQLENSDNNVYITPYKSSERSSQMTIMDIYKAMGRSLLYSPWNWPQ